MLEANRESYVKRMNPSGCSIPTSPSSLTKEKDAPSTTNSCKVKSVPLTSCDQAVVGDRVRGDGKVLSTGAKYELQPPSRVIICRFSCYPQLEPPNRIFVLSVPVSILPLVLLSLSFLLLLLLLTTVLEPPSPGPSEAGPQSGVRENRIPMSSSM